MSKDNPPSMGAVSGSLPGSDCACQVIALQEASSRFVG